MVALCKATAVPVRYVSGHLLGEAGGSHAWVEVLVPDRHGARAYAGRWVPGHGPYHRSGLTRSGLDEHHVVVGAGGCAGSERRRQPQVEAGVDDRQPVTVLGPAGRLSLQPLLQ
jgi:Transglutaminase-like superfamily